MDAVTIETERLLLRPASEADRSVFTAMFCSDDFMVFSGGTLQPADAHARFDKMLQNGSKIAFAKQPVIERQSGQIIGYSGVAPFEFEGRRRLEFGYRLVPHARGRGYATEAGRALLDVAARTFDGEILAMIDPTNAPSQRVASKIGFSFWKMATVNGFLDQIHRVTITRNAGAPTDR